jgi:hypothetical protein
VVANELARRLFMVFGAHGGNLEHQMPVAAHIDVGEGFPSTRVVGSSYAGSLVIIFSRQSAARSVYTLGST